MSFDSIPEDRQESFPCTCGGNIVKSQMWHGHWECDTCEVVHRVSRETVDMKTSKTTDVRPANWKTMRIELTNIATTIAIVLIAIAGIINARNIRVQSQRIDETQAEIQLLQGKFERLAEQLREVK